MPMRWEKPTTVHLDILTPELLLEMANEARDYFEWLDSFPAQPGAQFDGSGEATVELLEELVRVRAPQLATQLASYMPGDDTTPEWKRRHMEFQRATETVSERDSEEPVAHLAVAMDDLIQCDNGRHAVDDMLLTASCALLRAQAAAGERGDRHTHRLVSELYHEVNNLLAS